MPLPDPIIEVLATFRPLFTAPTWRKLMTLLTGTLLAQGRRTVAAALRHTGNDMAANFSTFHQVLNRARWSPLAVSRQLLLLIVETFVPAGACVDLVIDETLERRWGSKVSKRGHYRDSALSSRERSVSSPGLRWIVMAVVVTLPWTKQRRALPFLCVLATTPEVSERLGKRHKTVGMWAHQMVSLVRRWLPDRSIKLMGDTAYSVLELGLHANAQQVTLVTTGRLDAVLASRHLQNAAGTPLAVPVSSANACLLWKRSYRIRKPSGRSSPWTGTVKGSEPWRSAPVQRFGTAMDAILCRSVGS
jgi:hypothetical protein